ncbi:MAG: hypothetical protein JO293_02585 [Candidatus Eremiobacteraeota bacterium]|nr:hypothetical protein [Candidatus Eremiobacteraeota bacterium]
MSLSRVLLACLFLSACGSAAAPGGYGHPGGGGPTSPPGPTPTPLAGVASIGGCQVFPSSNPWNEDVSGLPVDPNSAQYLAQMNASTTNLHPDFGSNPTYGIPYVTVHGNTQPFVTINFTLYGSESDPGPYPVPPNAPVEGGSGSTGDRHVLVVDIDNCIDYEMYDAFYVGPGWNAGSGAVWHFNSNALRPYYWTSADAAGLPIVAGLARYDETVQTGAIYHALRFTVQHTQAGFILPATHFASNCSNIYCAPMGLRVRLKASYDISGFHGASLVILTALKKYGMIVADNGSDWYISGSTDTRWDDTDLDQLNTVPASAFEVVQTGSIIH